MISSVNELLVFPLPEEITMSSITHLTDRLAPSYPKLTAVSAQYLKHYDSCVFAYVLELLRRSPVCVEQERIECLHFPATLQALLKSYGLVSILSCEPMILAAV